MNRSRFGWRVGIVLILAAALIGCTGRTGPVTTDEQPYAEQSDGRPVVDLEFRVADDLASVSGTERVVFTPDLEVCEIVFRAWPNKPATARRGNSLEVTSVSVDGAHADFSVSAAGAPESSPGTLVEIPLAACAPAGTAITAELGFQLQLGPRTDERVGVSEDGNLAWFGTAYPLLAWENGIGWARDDAVAVTGETVTSETFNLESLRVVAPSRYAVLGAGKLVGERRDDAAGVTTHEFSDTSLRDLTVTVGDLEVVDRRVAGAVIHVGGPAGELREPLDAWADAVAASVQKVSDYLGAVPDENIWVSIIPDQTEGIEYPDAMQLGNLRLPRDSWLITHEVAHLWFYGLVGNNQARHPWMDESFASFVQRVVDDPGMNPEPSGSPRRESSEVGLAMEDWDEYRRADSQYVRAVYEDGADMLIEARRAAGPAAFDEALRGYLRTNAHRIATPEDVEQAFGHLPAAIDRMREAGAL